MAELVEIILWILVPENRSACAQSPRVKLQLCHFSPPYLVAVLSAANFVMVHVTQLGMPDNNRPISGEILVTIPIHDYKVCML